MSTKLGAASSSSSGASSSNASSIASTASLRLAKVEASPKLIDEGAASDETAVGGGASVDERVMKKTTPIAAIRSAAAAGMRIRGFVHIARADLRSSSSNASITASKER